MSDWLEHSVQIEVPVSIDQVWNLWADLEQMPRWMKWIDSVKVSEEDPSLSRWKLSTGGLDFSWQSRILKQIQHQIIQWESVDGLPNRGAIRFYDRGADGSIVKLTVGYLPPGFLRRLLENSLIRRGVESSLQADMERFREYAMRAG